MSRIDDLIAQHCPNGVEFKGLEKVCVIANNKRKPVASGLRIPGKTPYYGANNIQDYVEGYTHEGNYVLVAEDGSADLDKYSIQYTEGKFWANNHVHVIKGKDGLNNRFLFHYLTSMNFRPFLSGGGRAKLTKGKLVEIKIPVPPLPVQQEIVDILDKFTKLEAELEAELEARQQQYSHYRDELLNFDGKDVPLLDLDSVCVKTLNIKWKEHIGEEYEYIDLSSVDRENNQITETQKISDSNAPSRAQQIVQKDDIIFGTTRPTLKRFCVIPEAYDGQICSTGFCVLRADPKKILPKFLYFSITTSAFNDYVERNQEGAGYPSISNSKVKSFQISVPAIEEQKRIVAILDKFDALVNDISSGLPAEITARRQQYEHYRNKLLTFQEAA